MRKWYAVAVTVIAGALPLLGLLRPGWGAPSFDVGTVVEQARREPPLVILSNSGLIVDIAKAFERKYGVGAVGIKADSLAQAQRVIRERSAGRVTVGVLNIEDGAMLEEMLLRQGYVENWVPPQFAGDIPRQWQEPLVAVWSAKVLAYNSSVYRACPVYSLWDLTEERWRGKVVFNDPLLKPEMLTWFSWLTREDYARTLSEAFRRRYGRALEVRERNAGYEFVRRLAANRPIVTRSDDDAAKAIGAPGQKDPPVGILSLAKFAQAPEKGEALGACTGVYPYMGWAYPRHLVIVKGNPSPNAARLFVHFVMSGEGARPFIEFYGEFSTNRRVPASEIEGRFLGPRAYWKRYLVFLEPVGNRRAWEMRQELADFWQLAASR